MLLAWRGKGLVMLIPVIGCLTVTQLGVNALTQDAKYYKNHAWPKVLGFCMAAAVCWPIGRWLNRRILFDDLTGSGTGEAGTLGCSALLWPSLARELKLTDSQLKELDRLVDVSDKHLRRLDPDAQWDQSERDKVARLREELLTEVQRRVVRILTPEQQAQWDGFRNGRVVLWLPGPGHSLFFIPVQYWWIVCLALGVLTTFA